MVRASVRSMFAISSSILSLSTASGNHRGGARDGGSSRRSAVPESTASCLGFAPPEVINPTGTSDRGPFIQRSSFLRHALRKYKIQHIHRPYRTQATTFQDTN